MSYHVNEQGYYNEPPYYPRPLPHSGLGILSLAVAAVAGVGAVGMFVVAAVVGQQLGEDHPIVFLVGLGFIGVLALAVGGVVVGGIGMTQRGRNVTLAIVGLVVNGLIALAIVGLIVIGLMMD
jgi:hypothetical protein